MTFSSEPLSPDHLIFSTDHKDLLFVVLQWLLDLLLGGGVNPQPSFPTRIYLGGPFILVIREKACFSWPP